MIAPIVTCVIFGAVILGMLIYTILDPPRAPAPAPTWTWPRPERSDPPLPRPPARPTDQDALESPVEQQLLARLREQPADEETRLVYGDWLEERGQLDQASFVRGDANVVDAIALGTHTGHGWRAITYRGSFACTTRSCAARWDLLQPLGEDPCVRRCGYCKATIRYCRDRDEARVASQRQERAILDVAV